jgi:hypothetical protein
LLRALPLTSAGLFAKPQERETASGMLFPEWYES